MHAAAIESCPRCLIRDRVSAPLTFKAFRLPAERPGTEQTGSGYSQPAAGSRSE